MNGGEESGDSVKRCPRCGTTLHSFSKKYSYSMNRYYCVKCAEELDKNFLAQMSCAVCGKHLYRDEAKYVMSSKFFGGEAMPITERLVCASCHNVVKDRMHYSSAVENTKSMQKAAKAIIRKSVIRGMFAAKNTPRV